MGYGECVKCEGVKVQTSSYKIGKLDDTCSIVTVVNIYIACLKVS